MSSVSNALRVVTLLADASEPVRVSDVADVLGTAPSTAHRVLATLVSHGFAEQDPRTRRYRAGFALTGLALRGLIDRSSLVPIARPALERLSEVTGETIHLSVLEGLDVVGIDHIESLHTLVVRHPVGSRVPAHATAVGKALLAFSPQVVEVLLSRGLRRLTPHTVQEPQAFRAELAEVRRRGYAVNVRQRNIDTAGVAAAVLEAGHAVAAVGVSGPASRVGKSSRLRELGHAARATANEIAASLPAPHP